MEGEMRQFTSLAGLDENDETFEAVIRQEFQIMRKKFEN